jgi:hypothetical protein
MAKAWKKKKHRRQQRQLRSKQPPHTIEQALSARMMANYNHSHFITPFSLFRRINSSQCPLFKTLFRKITEITES